MHIRNTGPMRLPMCALHFCRVIQLLSLPSVKEKEREGEGGGDKGGKAKKRIKLWV